MRGQKTSLERATESSPFATANFWEMYCFTCKTSEDHRDDKPGFAAWYERWLSRD